MISRKLCVFTTILFIAAGAAAQEQVDENSTVTYPAAYFDQYGPLTVNDMLDRVPGIDMILQQNFSSSFDGGDRGLGAESSILIDGKRMAGKANEARAQLDRISADQVNYIEIIRGTSSDLDVQNVGQVVNIVLLESQSSSSIAVDVNATYFDDGNTEPGGTFSLSGQSGRLTYLLSVGAETGYRHGELNQNSVNGDFSPNDRRIIEDYSEQETYSFNSNLTFDLTPQDRLALNLLYSDADPPRKVFREITDWNPVVDVVTYEREDIPATSESWEIGGDYEHQYADGSRLKALFIVNDKDNHITRERFISTPEESTEFKDLFLDTTSRYRERIVRGSYTFSLTGNQGLEVGIEGAQTIQDSGLLLGLPGPGQASSLHGGLNATPFPNAFSTVEEIRYEPFAIHNWQISPRMSLETSVVGEWSEIEQTGDVNKKRDFDYIKPKFDFRYDISRSLQFNASLENVVSQLSFRDFSRATNERDDDQDTVVGNPTLEPEESWQAEFGFDYRLPNDAGTLNARYFYYRYDNKIGQIDVSPSDDDLQSTRGNIGSAAAYGLITNASLRLGFIGLPTALVTGSFTLQESEFHRDPFAPKEHGFPPYDRGGGRIGFRHDVPERSLSYGMNYFGRIDGNRTFFDIDNRFEFIFPSNLSAFVEIVGFAGLTYRLEASNIENDEVCSERRRFDGRVLDGILKEVEFNCTKYGRQFALKIRGTF